MVNSQLDCNLPFQISKNRCSANALLPCPRKYVHLKRPSSVTASLTSPVLSPIPCFRLKIIPGFITPSSVYPQFSAYPDLITLTVLYEWVLESCQTLCSTVKASCALELTDAHNIPRALKNILSPSRCLIKIAEIKEEKIQIKTAYFSACTV